MRRLVVIAALLAVPVVASAKSADDHGSFESQARGGGNGHGTEMRDKDDGGAFDGRNFIELASPKSPPKPPGLAEAPGKHYALGLGHADPRGGPHDAVPTVAIVPEPETLALMLSGLAGIGYVASRRRKS